VAQVELFARTEVGCVRKRNEDHFVVANLASREQGLQVGARVQQLSMGGTLIAVCDGMGGAAAGDLASSIAGDTHTVIGTSLASSRSASCVSSPIASSSTTTRV